MSPLIVVMRACSDRGNINGCRFDNAVLCD